MSTMIWGCFLLAAFVCVSLDACSEDPELFEMIMGEIEVLKRNQERCSSQLEKIEDVKNRLHDTERRLKVAEARIVELQLGPSKHSIQTLDSDIRHKRFFDEQKIGFTAYLSQDVTHMGKQHTIVYDRVISNFGQSYDSQTGIFTCPVSGMYYFSSSVGSRPNEYVNLEIVIDGHSLVYLHTQDYTLYGHDQGGNSVLTQCNAGQNVWVRLIENRGTSIYSEKFTTFSGFLLLSD